MIRERTRAGTLGAMALAALLFGAPRAFGQPEAQLVQEGRRLFIDAGCDGCHTIGKVGTQGMASDLSQVGAKYDRADLTKWLQDPAAQKPIAHMPKIELGKNEVAALAAYLSSMR